ncbi:uncharacterized protein B0I36DRAFT_31661 [Microdochium trichocladiopsis]|uniref:Uncharacterized protein n=1 Tax=Microdochium trichocladiopsis TaxID=1682393 RepID=A0A9P8XZH1_9PEZI|nr:uncharacterized protein B0I36DRAFT_31661 [Microdochium trichocladiopsis]KAH7021384.1 hypothetical protein B0I36DRAFT_31661 [Microdochium trichocladiopsis]
MSDPADHPSLCGGLWDNLNGKGYCGIMTHGASCGTESEGSNRLVWWFTVALWCRSRDIREVWAAATGMQYGEIQCSNLYPYYQDLPCAGYEDSVWGYDKPPGCTPSPTPQ